MTNQVDLEGIPAAWIEAGLKICTDLLGGKINGDKINDIQCPICSKPRAYTHVKDPLTIICNRKNNCRNTFLLKEFPHHFSKEFLPLRKEIYKRLKKYEPIIIKAQGKTVAEVEREFFKVHKETGEFPTVEGKARGEVPIPKEFLPLVEELENHFNLPREFHFINLLGSLSSLMGNGYQVQVKKGWVQPAFLWSLLISPKGTTKSAIGSIYNKPLKQIQKERAKSSLCEDEVTKIKREHLQTMLKAAVKAEITGKKAVDCPKELWQVDQNAWRERLLHQIGKLPKEKISLPSLIIQDITSSSLIDSLRDSPRSIHADYDELSLFMELCKGTYAIGLRQLFLQLHNGQGVISKKVKDSEIILEDPGLSICSNAQPDVIKKFFAKDSKFFIDDGFFERFQLIAEPQKPQSRKLSNRDMDLDILEKYFDIMNQFYRPYATDKPYPLHEKARSHFFDIEFEIQKTKYDAKSDYLAGCLGKAPNLLARLSLIFLVIEKVFEGSPLEEVQERHVKRAHKVYEWQLSEWKKISEKYEI